MERLAIIFTVSTFVRTITSCIGLADVPWNNPSLLGYKNTNTAVALNLYVSRRLRTLDCFMLLLFSRVNSYSIMVFCNLGSCHTLEILNCHK